MELPAGAFQWPNILCGAYEVRGPTWTAFCVTESIIVRGGVEDVLTCGVPSAVKANCKT